MVSLLATPIYPALFPTNPSLAFRLALALMLETSFWAAAGPPWAKARRMASWTNCSRWARVSSMKIQFPS
jgi:hypothetical protein